MDYITPRFRINRPKPKSHDASHLIIKCGYVLPKNGQRSLRAVLVLAIFALFAACGKTVHWKQEVLLQDGKVINVDRRSKQARVFLSNSIVEYEQSLSFINPATKEKILWSFPKGIMPRMLNFENGIPYMVFRAGSVADYMDWGCPNPPHLVFAYQNRQWVQHPFVDLPKRFKIPNLLDAAHSDDKLSDDGVVSVDEMKLYLKAGKWIRADVIDGKTINPMEHGCTEEVLIKQGRQAEITH